MFLTKLFSKSEFWNAKVGLFGVGIAWKKYTSKSGCKHPSKLVSK